MDYPCGKFGDCTLSCSIVKSYTQTHTHVDKRLTPATLVGMSNNYYSYYFNLVLNALSMLTLLVGNTKYAWTVLDVIKGGSS